MKYIKTAIADQETIINFFYDEQIIKIYSSRPEVIKLLTKALGNPTTKFKKSKTYWSGANWDIKFNEFKKIEKILFLNNFVDSEIEIKTNKKIGKTKKADEKKKKTKTTKKVDEKKGKTKAETTKKTDEKNAKAKAKTKTTKKADEKKIKTKVRITKKADEEKIKPKAVISKKKEEQVTKPKNKSKKIKNIKDDYLQISFL